MCCSNQTLLVSQADRSGFCYCWAGVRLFWDLLQPPPSEHTCMAASLLCRACRYHSVVQCCRTWHNKHMIIHAVVNGLELPPSGYTRCSWTWFDFNVALWFDLNLSQGLKLFCFFKLCGTIFHISLQIMLVVSPFLKWHMSDVLEWLDQGCNVVVFLQGGSIYLTVGL